MLFDKPKLRFVDFTLTPKPIDPWDPPVGIPLLAYERLDKPGVCTRPRANDGTGYYLLRPVKIPLLEEFFWSEPENLAVVWPASRPGSNEAMFVTTPEALEVVKRNCEEFKP